jgi:hypothetical protein
MSGRLNSQTVQVDVVVNVKQRLQFPTTNIRVMFVSFCRNNTGDGFTALKFYDEVVKALKLRNFWLP